MGLWAKSFVELACAILWGTDDHTLILICDPLQDKRGQDLMSVTDTSEEKK